MPVVTFLDDVTAATSTANATGTAMVVNKVRSNHEALSTTTSLSNSRNDDVLPRLAIPYVDNNNEYYQNYLQNYLQNYNYCNNNNYIVPKQGPNKNTGAGAAEEDSHIVSPPSLTTSQKRQLKRPFSLQPEAFFGNNNHQQTSKECTSVQELLHAISNGKRKWIDDTIDQLDDTIDDNLVKKEQYPSYFVPSGCHVPMLTGNQNCDILQKFAHVVFLGDSLQGHVYQGLVSSIKPNLIDGWTRLSNDPTMSYEYCKCDGQYSQNMACSKRNVTQMYRNLVLLRSNDYCDSQSTIPTNENSNKATTYFLGSFVETGGKKKEKASAGKNKKTGNIGLKHIDCTRKEEGDILLILQGGLWFQSQSMPTFFVVQRILKNYDNLQECMKQRRLLVIWCSYNYVSPEISRHQYPHQSFENGTKFNIEMSAHLSAMLGKNLTTINWMNMTKAAQTSDGVHFLSDVNHLKAQQLLILGAQMQSESMYYCDYDTDSTCQRS